MSWRLKNGSALAIRNAIDCRSPSSSSTPSSASTSTRNSRALPAEQGGFEAKGPEDLAVARTRPSAEDLRGGVGAEGASVGHQGGGGGGSSRFPAETVRIPFTGLLEHGKIPLPPGTSTASSRLSSTATNRTQSPASPSAPDRSTSAVAQAAVWHVE